MLSFKTFCEAFDSHHDFTKHETKTDEWGDHTHKYSFKDSVGNTKSVKITHRGSHGAVVFHDEGKHHPDDYRKFHATGELKHSAIKAFSTVGHILKKHAKDHPGISHFRFESSGDEPTRVKLYKKMTHHLGGSTAEDDYDLIQHIIPTDKLRK